VRGIRPGAPGCAHILDIIPKDPLMGASKVADLAERLSGKII